MSPEAVDVIQERLAIAVRDDEIAGGLLIVHGKGVDRAVWPFGMVTVDSNMRVPTETDNFLLTSVSKPIVATEILQLASRGRLDLHAPVADYIPLFAVNGKERVTIAHLLTHTGGLDNETNLIEGPASDLTANDYLEIALRSKLAFEPGTAWQYCSPGYWVLGEVISSVSGLSYIEHLKEHISKPLGTSLGYALTERPTNYVEAVRPFPQEPEQIRRSGYPAGAIVGTADDVLQFGRAVLDTISDRRSGGPLGLHLGGLLAVEFGHGTMFGRPVRWTLGWELGGPGSFHSSHTLFHVGASGTALWVDPVGETVVVLLTATWWQKWRVLAEIGNAAFHSVARSAGLGAGR